jgi:hypothetical protein
MVRDYRTSISRQQSGIAGPIEFFMTVLAVDMVAPTYGKHHLKDFFLENKGKV